MPSMCHDLVIVAAAIGATFTSANASTHYYRYDLPTPSCFVDQFRVEIAPRASLAGPSWRVERDALGRPWRWEALRDGKAWKVYTAHFTGNATRMAGWDYFRGGAPAGSWRCLSDASGVLRRFEILDASGKLTEYDLFSPVYSPALGREIWTAYTPQGKPTLHDTGYFSRDGVLIRIDGYTIPGGVEHDVEFNPSTGEVQSRKIIDARSHQLRRVEKLTYDKNGDRIRGDIFDGRGVAYGRMDYAADLETRRTYHRPNGTVETYRYDYDGNRQLAGARLSVNGKFVCKLVYEPGPDGSASTTEARGPDGALWAVYPGRAVEEITSDGRDPNNPSSTIYRRGTWW